MIEFERVLPILKEVARGEMHWDDNDDKFCPFCEYTEWVSDQKVHDEDCIVVQARCTLKEHSIVYHLYSVDYEMRHAWGKGWFMVHCEVEAYTEEEAAARYPEDTDLDDMYNSKRHNVQVKLLRDIEDREAT